VRRAPLRALRNVFRGSGGGIWPLGSNERSERRYPTQTVRPSSNRHASRYHHIAQATEAESPPAYPCRVVTHARS
jgi:hypothetical protein